MLFYYVLEKIPAWFAALWCVAATAFAIFDYGGILPVTRWWLLASSIPVLISLAPLWWFHARSTPRSMLPVTVLLAAFVLALLQTTPTPTALHKSISPKTLELREQFALNGASAASMPQTPQNATSNDSVPLSIAPSLTRRSLGLIAIASVAAIFGIAAFAFNTTTYVWLVGIALVGCVSAFYGIDLRLDRQVTEMGYGASNLALGGQPFGMFVNRNNAAGVLMIGVCAALGWIAFSFGQASSPTGRTPTAYKNQVDASRTWVIQLERVLNQPFTVAAAVVLIFLLFGIFSTGSRGGLLGVAGAMLTALAFTRRSTRRVGFAVATVAIVVSLILVNQLGVENSASLRLRNISSDFDVAYGSGNIRLQHWKDGLRAAWNYLPVGSGLGTYRYAYLPFQQDSSASWFVNADNMWIESLVEQGILGIGLVAVFLIITFRGIRRAVQPMRTTAAKAAGVAAIAAMVGCIISQTFDFGITLPAMLIPAISLLAGAASRGVSYVPKKKIDPSSLLTRTPTKPPKNQRLVNSLISLAAITIYGGTFSAIAYALPIEWDAAETMDISRQISIISNRLETQSQDVAEATTTIDSLLSRANPLLQRIPDDPDCALALTAASLAQVRIKETLQLRTQEELAPATAWKLTDPGIARTILAHGTVRTAESLYTDDTIDQLKNIRNEMSNVLDANPLHDLLRFHMLEMDFVDNRLTEPLISQLSILRSQSPEQLWAVAQKAWESPGPEVASSLVRHILTLDDRQLRKVIARLIKTKTDVPLASFFPKNRADMMAEAALALQQKQPVHKIEALRLAAEASLEADIQRGEKSVLSSGAKAATAARLASINQEWDQAAQQWKAAIHLQPHRIDWLEQQILCLVHAGETTKAIQLAEQYARARPENRKLKKILKFLKRIAVKVSAPAAREKTKK